MAHAIELGQQPPALDPHRVLGIGDTGRDGAEDRERTAPQHAQQLLDRDLARGVLERLRVEPLDAIAEVGVERAQVAFEVLVGDEVEQLMQADLLGAPPHPQRGLVAVPHVVAELVQDEPLDDVATVAHALQDRQRCDVDLGRAHVREAPLIALGRDVDGEAFAGQLAPAHDAPGEGAGQLAQLLAAAGVEQAVGDDALARGGVVAVEQQTSDQARAHRPRRHRQQIEHAGLRRRRCAAEQRAIDQVLRELAARRRQAPSEHPLGLVDRGRGVERPVDDQRQRRGLAALERRQRGLAPRRHRAGAGPLQRCHRAGVVARAHARAQARVGEQWVGRTRQCRRHGAAAVVAREHGLHIRRTGAPDHRGIARQREHLREAAGAVPREQLDRDAPATSTLERDVAAQPDEFGERARRAPQRDALEQRLELGSVGAQARDQLQLAGLAEFEQANHRRVNHRLAAAQARARQRVEVAAVRRLDAGVRRQHPRARPRRTAARGDPRQRQPLPQHREGLARTRRSGGEHVWRGGLDRAACDAAAHQHAQDPRRAGAELGVELRDQLRHDRRHETRAQRREHAAPHPTEQHARARVPQPPPREPATQGVAREQHPRPAVLLCDQPGREALRVALEADRNRVDQRRHRVAVAPHRQHPQAQAIGELGRGLAEPLQLPRHRRQPVRARDQGDAGRQRGRGLAA
ncbi:MAG: hypothetical protein U0168_31880, partial [Nannocystaceae bacterium]